MAWRERMSRRANSLPHVRHLKGFSSVCLRECRMRCSCPAKPGVSVTTLDRAEDTQTYVENSRRRRDTGSAFPRSWQQVWQWSGRRLQRSSPSLLPLQNCQNLSRAGCQRHQRALVGLLSPSRCLAAQAARTDDRAWQSQPKSIDEADGSDCDCPSKRLARLVLGTDSRLSVDLASQALSVVEQASLDPRFQLTKRDRRS